MTNHSLDPDGVLELCRRFGSYRGVATYLTKEGVSNPKTGRPYSHTGIRHLAAQAKGFGAWKRSLKTKEERTRTKFDRALKQSREGDHA